MPDETMTGPAEAPSRCPACDAEVAPPGRFCVSCGTPVATPGDGEGVAAAAPAASSAQPNVAAGTDLLGGPWQWTSTELPPASGRGASRGCTSCGAVNARDRELCVACGLDLDPDDRTAVEPRPPLEAGERVARRSAARRRLRALVAAVAAGVVVVGAITAGLALAELGPFAVEEEPLEPATFVAERYPRQPEVLELSGVATLTSAAPVGDRVFSPDRLVDADPLTAWRADAGTRPPDTDETVDVLLAAPAWVTAIAVSNGDHHDAAAYEASGRVQRAEVWFDGDLVVGATLLDVGRQRQVLALEEPILTTAVRLSLVEVLAGVRYDEPALSTVELRGYPATEEDVPLALQRAELRPAAGALVSTVQQGPPSVLPRTRADQGS
ncbi:MAG: zinc ribbon domain-containing protein [Nitriliruptor sp.]|nr:MAG: zinc ribbon domain-containing protein [Nitriliruptor sp.]